MYRPRPLAIAFAILTSTVAAQISVHDSTPQTVFQNTARFGQLPARLEDAVFDSLGPRFGEGILNGKPSDTDLSSCLSCAWPLISDLPCIYQSLRAKNDQAMSQCGVKKTEICQCTSCTPSVIQPFLEGYCADSEAQADSLSTSAVDTAFAQSVDPGIKAFLGTATSVDMAAAKFHIFGSISQPNGGNGGTICQLSEECRCCLGAPGKGGECIGRCIY